MGELNLPGPHKYRSNEQLAAFQHWGEASILDLDHDGLEEMIIEFPGLHLAAPDLTIVRLHKGTLEASSYIASSLGKGQGISANLIRDQLLPIISLSNEQENRSTLNYHYDNGILKIIK
ncbi:MAG: hypothetical protein K0R67_3007 [Paenibacillus sp.]|nr:hypothetical protein [Paenibacillus sp.]